MRNIGLSVLIALFSMTFAFAQKAKVQTAFNFYKEPYKQYDKAKEAIDEAAKHEQSMGMAKTWYYRGLIYSALYKDPKYGQLCDNCLVTAYESYKKAMELDPKNEWADQIEGLLIPQTFGKVFTEGVEQYQAKNFTASLAAFESGIAMMPTDTSCILNAAYAAERAGDKAKAKSYYQKLADMKVNDPKIYLALSGMYREEKNNEKALEVIRNARKDFPSDINLMLAEINILLSTGKNEEATKALDDATKKDPNNPSLYLALGSTYDNLANPKDAAGKDLPKPAGYNDYMTKAEAAYKKGLEIAPDNYEINYNLGALYFNQAAEMANSANTLKSDTEYKKAKEASDMKFKQAQPFLEKSLERNPMKTDDDKVLYEGSLNSLKQLYVRTGDMENYNRIKTLMEKK